MSGSPGITLEMVVVASSLGTPESGKHMQAAQDDERVNCQRDTTRKERVLQLWGWQRSQVSLPGGTQTARN